MQRRLSALRTQAHIGYEPDAQIDDFLVEVSVGASSFRNVRATLLAMAYLLADKLDKHALLVLTRTRITQPRLERELDLVEQVIKPGIAGRLHVTIESEGRYSDLPAQRRPGFTEKLREIVNAEIVKATRKKKLANSSAYAILEILIHEWLFARGPMTTDRLMKISGSSYPTVAEALKLFEPLLFRHSDRQVELRRFPHHEWTGLVAVSERIRGTKRFADRSGQPRSPEAMIRRLQKRNLPNVAVGGVIAARSYYLPSFDLVGTPRLDLTVNTIAGVDWDFVKDLDPAMENAERGEPANLVIHQIHRKESLFAEGHDGVRYTDPVECLLDLHEARLEQQAQQLLQTLIGRRKSLSLDRNSPGS